MTGSRRRRLGSHCKDCATSRPKRPRLQLPPGPGGMHDKCEVPPKKPLQHGAAVEMNPIGSLPWKAASPDVDVIWALQPYPDGLSSTWACGLLGRSLIIQSIPAIPAEQNDCPFTTTTAAVRPGANAEEYHPSCEITHSSPGRETEKSRALDSIMTHARVFPFENKHRLKQARACRMLPGPR